MMEENIKYNVKVEGTEELDNLKNKLDEVNNLQLSSDESTKKTIDNFKNFGKTAGGLASSLTALKGVQSLLGIENENLQKTFVTLQNGMAIAAGANGIGDVVEGGYKMIKTFKESSKQIKILTGLQKIWNFVMSLNPVMLVVAGITALTAGIIGLTKWIGKNNNEQKINNALLEENTKLINRNTSERELNVRLLKAEGANEEAILAKRLENSKLTQKELKDEEDRLVSKKKLSDAEKKRLDELKDLIKKEEDLYKNLNIQFTLFTIEEREKKERLAAELRLQNIEDDKTRELAILESKYKEDIEYAYNDSELKKQIEIKYQNDIKEINKKYNTSKLEDDKKIAELKLQNITDNRTRELAIIKSKYDEEVIAAKGNKELLNQLEIKYNSDKEEINDKFDEEDKATKQRNLDWQIAFDQKQLDEANKQYDQDVADYKEAQQAKIEAAEAEFQHRQDLANLSVDLASNVVNLVKMIGEKNKGLQKAAVIAEGAVGISRIITSTMAANAGALATPQAILTSGASAAPVIALNKINAGIGIATTIASTAKALQSLGGGGSISSPSIQGGASRPNSPQITDRLTAVRNIKTPDEIELQRQPLKAYILESELQTNRLKTDNKNKEINF